MFRTSFIGYPVDSVTSHEVLAFVEKAICYKECHFIGVQNANKMYLSDKYPEVKETLNRASVILPENSINLGMALLRKSLPERNVGGVVMMERLLSFAHQRKLSVYLLGATENNLNVLVKRITTEFPGICLLGYRNGFYQEEETERIVRTIAACSPNFLFVGMGSPKQEIFIGRNLHKLNANICMGVGGSFNVISGLEKPAPPWTKYGLEWLYRSLQDPQKFKRYIVVNTYFIYRCIQYLVKGKRTGEQCSGVQP